MRLGRTSGIVTLVVAGVAALVALSPLGHMVFLLGLVSMIGIPLAFLVAFLPSLFLVLLALWSLFGVWRGHREGRGGAVVVHLLVLAVLAEVFVLRAWRVEAWLDGRAAELVSEDRDALGAVGPIDTLAVLRNTRVPQDVKNPCDDLCQRLLLTGAVRRVFAATAAPPPVKRPAKERSPDWPALDPSDAMAGTLWRFETRDVCPGDVDVKPVRPIHVPQPARPKGAPIVQPIRPEELIRLRIASGDCLVGEPATLAVADALVAQGTLRSGLSDYQAGFDAWADTLSAWRLSFWRRRDGVLVEDHRRTGLHWSAPPGVFAPVILTGYQFATTNGWLRFGRSRNRAPHEGESPLGAFVSERLGLDLLPRVAPSSAAGADVSARSGLRAAQATAVDRILDGPGEPSAFDVTLITDYLANIASFRRVGDDPVEDGDARRVLRIVDDRRVNLLQPTTLAVKLAVRDQPATAVAFAAALFGRLDGLPAMPEGAARGRWSEQIRIATGALAMLPAEAMAPHRATVVALMRDPDRRTAANNLLRHLDVFGPEIVPEVFAMMDEAAASRGIPGTASTRRRDWTDIWNAGANSICRLAREIPNEREPLRERAQASAREKLGFADETVAAALLRMGATEDDVRATLAIDPRDEKAMRSFGFLVRRAARDDACR